jgi:hypothetical protein
MCSRSGTVPDSPGELQQISVAQLLRIEQDLDGFGVRAVIAVGGIWNVATAVADASLTHAWQPTNEVLHAPEAATGENRFLQVVSHGSDRKY